MLCRRDEGHRSEDGDRLDHLLPEAEQQSLVREAKLRLPLRLADMAEDLFQDSFALWWQISAGGTLDIDPVSWIRATIKNKLQDLLKKEDRHCAHHGIDAVDAHAEETEISQVRELATEEVLVSRELTEAVSSAIARLPLAQMRVVLRLCVEDEPLETVAEELEISSSAVYKRLGCAMGKLGVCLRAEGWEEWYLRHLQLRGRLPQRFADRGSTS